MTITENQIENFAEALLIIAARKMEYLNLLCSNLSDNAEFKHMNADEQKNLKAVIERIVSNLDNEMFLNPEEKAFKKINPNLTLSELKIDSKKLSAYFKEVLKKEHSGLFG
jgi:hypothetical protein